MPLSSQKSHVSIGPFSAYASACLHLTRCRFSTAVGVLNISIDLFISFMMCRLLFVTKKRTISCLTQRFLLMLALDKGSTFLFIKNMSLLIGACGLLTLCAAISLIVLGEKTSRTSTWSVVTLPLPGAIGAISFLSLLYASFTLPKCDPTDSFFSDPSTNRRSWNILPNGQTAFTGQTGSQSHYQSHPNVQVQVMQTQTKASFANEPITHLSAVKHGDVLSPQPQRKSHLFD